MNAEKILKRIKKDRKEVGLTQTELARRAGCHLNTIYNLEQGAHMPGLGLTLRIVNILEREKKRKVHILRLGQFSLPNRAS